MSTSRWIEKLRACAIENGIFEDLHGKILQMGVNYKQGVLELSHENVYTYANNMDRPKLYMDMTNEELRINTQYFAKLPKFTSTITRLVYTLKERKYVRIFEWQRNGYHFGENYIKWLAWYADPTKAENLAKEEPTADKIDVARKAFERYLWNTRYVLGTTNDRKG